MIANVNRKRLLESLKFDSKNKLFKLKSGSRWEILKKTYRGNIPNAYGFKQKFYNYTIRFIDYPQMGNIEINLIADENELSDVIDLFIEDGDLEMLTM